MNFVGYTYKADVEAEKSMLVNVLKELDSVSDQQFDNKNNRRIEEEEDENNSSGEQQYYPNKSSAQNTTNMSVRSSAGAPKTGNSGSTRALHSSTNMY